VGLILPPASYSERPGLKSPVFWNLFFTAVKVSDVIVFDYGFNMSYVVLFHSGGWLFVLFIIVRCSAFPEFQKLPGNCGM
jgi:hypothetical protein